MSLWLRLYVETLDDPKVQRLPDALFRTWVNLLCVAKRHDGILPPIDDLAFALRLDESEMSHRLCQLIDRGLIDNDDGMARPHGWDKRQFISDGATTERVKRWRENKRNVSSNVSSNVAATDKCNVIETETETDINLTSFGSSSAVADDPPPDEIIDPPKSKTVDKRESDMALLDRITDLWNAWAVRHRATPVKRLTVNRATHCRKRIEDLMQDGHATPEAAFEALLQKCAGSFFIRGSPRKPLEFDQIMAEGFMVKMLEGNFEYRPNGGQQWRG